jgi:P4 family phage/plasmid primase-like protien
MNNPKASDLPPEELARQFVDKTKVNGERSLIFWHGSFHQFSKGRFARVDDKALAVVVTKWLQRHYQGIRKCIVADLIVNLQACCSPRVEPEAYTWIGSPPSVAQHWQSSDLLHTPTRMVNLEALRKGETVHSIHATPAFLNLNALPHELDLNCQDEPKMLAPLREQWGEDSEAFELLQQWFGYALTRDYRYEKLLLLIGKARAGKGLVATALETMVGSENVGSLSLNKLGSNFGPATFLNKSLGVIADARLSPGKSQEAIEFLLSTVGRDRQTFDIKYQNHAEARLDARLVISANELPRFADRSRAIESRMLVLNFPKSFAGREDTSLKQQIQNDGPALIAWAAKGFFKLREQGRFTEPVSSQAVREHFVAMSSPVTAFADKRCRFNRNYSIELDDLYAEFQEWVAGVGEESLMTKIVFSKELRDAYTSVSSKRRTLPTGKITVLFGIGLREENRPSTIDAPSSGLRLATLETGQAEDRQRTG